MSFASVCSAGFLATALLTSVIGVASVLGWTRIDIPFILGTVLTSDRIRAKWIGWIAHFVLGLCFAFLYASMLSALSGNGIVLGVLFGLTHAVLVGTVLLNVALPPIHPRMGTELSAADSSPLLEPPGFMLLNYGRNTPVVTVLAHVLYGATLGWLIG